MWVGFAGGWLCWWVCGAELLGRLGGVRVGEGKVMGLCSFRYFAGLMRVDGEGWNSYHVQTQCCCSCTCSHFVARIWKT
jgi:hypothetical protein